jgi:hypothetical protein
MLFAATTESAARRCQASIYNCSIRQVLERVGIASLPMRAIAKTGTANIFFLEHCRDSQNIIADSNSLQSSVIDGAET